MDRGMQSFLKKACAVNILFYVNCFCWTYDPRKVQDGEDPELPFITYKYQDKLLVELSRIIGRDDALFEKSRDMGLTWICLVAFEHRWHFKRLQSFLLVSRNAALVDKRGDPDCLFWKIDFLHRRQPAWLLPPGRKLGAEDPNRTLMHLFNVETESTIDGTSTTSTAGIGGRRTGAFLDELSRVPPDEARSMIAGMQHTTGSRIMCGTPQGAFGAFYEAKLKMEREGRPIFTIHWSLHPEKAVGLHIDTSMPGRFKYRSPWYDRECLRATHQMEIKQDLDIDYVAATFQYFDPLVLEKLRQTTVKAPDAEGDLDFDPDTMAFRSFEVRDHGTLKLWCRLSGGSKPPAGRYVLGIDVAAGSRDSDGRGASNSVIVIVNRKTGEKVGEFATHGIYPHELAKIAVAIGKWFGGDDRELGGAYIIFEAGGPGGEFRDKLIEMGYRNLYYRRDEKSLGKKQSDTPGWYTTPDNKKLILGAYRAAVKEATFIEHSAVTVDEMAQYIWSPNGGVEHSSAMSTFDPTGARQNHGDRVIASALANWVLKEFVTSAAMEAKIVPIGSVAWAKAQVEKDSRERKAVYRW